MTISLAPAAFLADFREAAAFLTRLPLGPRGAGSREAAARATRAYPLVGALVALAGWLVFLLADSLGLPPFAAALLALGAQILLTGGLHEDGLADTADGFGGGTGREEKLSIMREGASGSYAILALLLSLGLRTSALTALAAPGAVLAALLAAESLSRAMLPLALLLERPARAEGLAVMVGRPPGGAVGQGLAIGGLLAWLGLGFASALLALLLALALALLLAGLARRQIGGVTGDVLGALQQVSVTALLLLAVVLA